MTILGTVYARDADVYFACNRVVSMMFMFACLSTRYNPAKLLDQVVVTINNIHVALLTIFILFKMWL